MQKDKILTKLKDFPLNQYGYIDPNILIFSQEVRDACTSNRCGKYNQNWQCPPGVGEISERRAECLKYKNALLFNTVTPIEDSFDIEGMFEAGKKHKQLSFEIREILKAYTDNLLMLGAGGCSVCERCSYLDNEPCRCPDATTASMEACGINVVELCPATGFKYINGPNTVTYFSLILF